MKIKTCCKLDEASITIRDGWTPFRKIAEAAPDQQAATVDSVAAVETVVVNRSFNLKVPLTR
jgi:hypothetical protein